MYNFAIYIPTYCDEINDVIRIPIYTAYYQPLINTFAPKCNSFELHCWQEEVDILQDAEQKICSRGTLHKIDNHDSTPICLISELSPTIIDELLMKPFDDCGRIKWFSLFLRTTSDLSLKEKMVNSTINSPSISLSHWGAEVHISNINGKELEYVKSLFSDINDEDVSLFIDELPDF